MKKELIFIILVLPLISALEITEIESNPLGKDSSQEWIEFYSENTANLSEYSLVNNDQQELSLSGDFKGYFIYKFKTQWLDNSDERIYLYQGTDLIQETPIFEDLKNNDFSFQICDESWLFLSSTPGQKNNCPEKKNLKEEETLSNESGVNISEEILEEKNNPPDKKEHFKEESLHLSVNSIKTSNEKTNFSPKTIHLNPQTIKTIENYSVQEQDKKPIIFFIGFCIFLAIIYLVQSKGKNKNEFRK